MRQCFRMTFLLSLITSALFVFTSVSMACDIAVVSSDASSTGRPMIWKSRDNSLSWQQEVVSYKRADNNVNSAAGGSVRVVDSTRFGDAQSGGVNEAGFAITNTTVYQLSPIHEYAANANLKIMNAALLQCRTVADFHNYISTWHTLSVNQHLIISGIFVVIDANGGAALFEITTGDHPADLYAYGGRAKFHMIDANTGFVINEDNALIGNDGQIGLLTDYTRNSSVTLMNPDRSVNNTGYHLSSNGQSILDSSGNVVDNGSNFCGIVNRTNSDFWENLYDDTPREDRARELMLQLKDEGRLNHRTMMQVVAKDTAISQYDLGSYPHLSNLDPGTSTQQSTFHTISRYCTNLAFVVDGVVPGDNAKLSTIWVNLGEPSVGVAVPFFPAANKVSDLMLNDTSYYRLFVGFVTGNFNATSFVNQAICNVRGNLYDNNTNISIPEAAIVVLPNVPPEILQAILAYEDMLDTASYDEWMAYEMGLIQWHVEFLDFMSQNDT
ncbi:MAG: hypothetical protein KKD44_16615, partial [Proteobacteria bacterium]|nr:hypothetical protein [Pseudomonadota bacterium]